MKFFNYPDSDIPSVFFPFGEAKAFSNCINCDRYLLQDNVEYIIEKAIRRYHEYETSDVIFEYAMCMQCAEKMRAELSVESQQKVQQYIENSKLVSTRQQLIEQSNWKIDDWLGSCAIKGEPVEDQNEYQIYGHFRGNKMVFSAMPYMISGSAVEEISQLLSAKTIDELNRFIDNNFGLPPELKEVIKNKPVVLI